MLMKIGRCLFLASRLRPKILNRNRRSGDVRIWYLATSCCALGLLLDGGLARQAIGQAQDAVAESAASEQVLFPGEAQRLWKSSDFGGDGEVRLDGDVMLLEVGQPLTGVTYQGKDLPKNNFEIALEARRVKGHDFFCCLTFPVDDSHCSLVVGGWAGTIVGLSCIDEKDAARNETTREMTFADQRWYRVKVRVTAGRIVATIDDEVVVDADINGKAISVRNEVLPSRPLGICTFQTAAEIRNVRLTRLPATQTP